MSECGACAVRGKVEQAVRDELVKMPEPYRSSALAATAVRLAAILDDRSTNDLAPAPVAREIRETLALLKAQVPANNEGSVVDDLQRRREAKLAQVVGDSR